MPALKAQILKWKNGKKAPFMLAFDDGVPTHLDVAIPALEKREIVGAFYINPGCPHFGQRRSEWQHAAESSYVSLANHTYTHRGATSVGQLEEELEMCNGAIHELTSAQKWPRLLSFGRPGGVPWTVDFEEEQALFAQFHLVQRPRFISPHHLGKPPEQTTAELLALVDEALHEGEVGQIGFHGVGGDWHLTPTECFEALLDYLHTHRDELWFCEPASWHKYQAERENLKLEILNSNALEIRLRLSCETDPNFYDLPLSLAVEVPQNWTQCLVTQGDHQQLVAAHAGAVRCEVLSLTSELILNQHP